MKLFRFVVAAALVCPLFAQAGFTLLPIPKMQFLDDDGHPLSGGKVYTYTAGTTIPQITYRDATGTPNTNPIILDSGGFASIFVSSSASYKVIVKDSLGDLIYTQDNVGALTFNDAFSGTINVKDYGAIGDGTHDDTVAVQTAASVVGTRGGSVLLFPSPGTYKLTSTVTIPINAQIQGYGATIKPSTPGMTVFSRINTVKGPLYATIKGLTFNAMGVSGIIGIQCTLCEYMTAQDLTFLGIQNNIIIDRGGQGVELFDLRSIGDGISQKAGNIVIYSSSDADYVYYVHLRDYHLTNDGLGVVGPGVWIRRGIGVLVDGYTANDLTVGGVQDAVQVENDSEGCKIQNSIWSSGRTGITVQQGAGTPFWPTFLTIMNVDADQEQQAGILILQGSFITINGGQITASVPAAQNSTGVLINGDVKNTNISISNLHIQGFTGASGNGVLIGAGASWIHVFGNQFNADFTAIGISGGGGGIRVHDNDAPGVTNFTSGTIAGASNWIYHNLGTGFHPGDIAPLFPATGVPVTNSTGYTVRYVLSGGTVSSVAINGVATSMTTGYLDPTETIAVTYTGSPTWKWIGE